MEFTLCDKNKIEIGVLPDSVSLDFDIGEENDVQIGCTHGQVEKGQWIVAFGTEYAAVLEENENNTTSTKETWNGNAPRKFLQQFIIQPPEGEAYLTVSGDANDIIRQIMSKAFGGLFLVPDTPSGIEIKSYQFDRYTDALTGFTKMLKQKEARINIEIIQGGTNEPFKIMLSAVNIKNLESEIQYSQDSKVSVKFKSSERGINHLICLGKGELTERQVVHLYAQFDGSVGNTQFYKGFRERTAVYENTNAETINDLIKEGEKRLKEIMDYSQMTMSVQDVEVTIGDIISGRNYDTGFYIAKPVIQKIVTISGGLPEIKYKVEGET